MISVFTAFERFDVSGRLVDQGTASLISGLVRCPGNWSCTVGIRTSSSLTG
jgi:hypothetical protein